MNTSQYMDKQIMDLSSSSASVRNQGLSLQSKDFIDLMNHPSQEDGDHDGATDNFSNDDDGIKREDILPSYDFQSIRPISSSSTKLDGIGAGSARVWSSAESKINSTSIPRNYSSLDTIEPARIIVEKERNVFGAGTMAEIDRAIKKHIDNLLHVMEGVSVRLTQLESRTRNLENSMDDLKVSFGNNQGIIDGKMRQLEHILREVQTGVEYLNDKQGGVEAQLKLCNMELSKVEKRLENQNSRHMDTAQVASTPPQSHPQLPPTTFPQSIPPLPMPPSVPPPIPIPQQNTPLTAQLPNQFLQNQIPSVPQRDPYYLPSGQAQEAPAPKYQAPPSQQPQLSPAAPPHQPYQPAPQLQHPQPPQPTQPSQLQPSLGLHPEETPYMPHQNYLPNLRQPPSKPSTGSSPSQQYYGAPSHFFEPPSNRSGSGFSSGYGQPAGSESYPFSGPPSQYGSSSPRKPQQLSAPLVAQSGGSGYPQLPTARVLPQALPTASGVGNGPSTEGSGNRVPVDDVIDKVSSMGFPRDHVRATVRKLTENGQSVDLNVVLDKLMNDGEIQPLRGWFGR